MALPRGVRFEVALQFFLKGCHGSSYFGSRAPPSEKRRYSRLPGFVVRDGNLRMETSTDYPDGLFVWTFYLWGHQRRGAVTTRPHKLVHNVTGKQDCVSSYVPLFVFIMPLGYHCLLL